MATAEIPAATAATSPPTPAARRRTALRVLGSVVLLTLLLVVVPFAEVRDALARVSPTVWASALAGYLALHLIGVAKWQLLVNTAGAGLRYPDAARCYYYGLFGNLFLPSVVGGDVVRAGLAMTLVRSRAGLLLGSVADRILDTLGLAALSGIGALLLSTTLDPQSRRVLYTVVGVLAVGVIAGVIALAIVRPTRFLAMKWRRKLVPVRRALVALRAQPGRMLLGLLLGMVLQGLLVVLNAWLGVAVGVDISLAAWLFVWPLAKIAAVLPITQGGIGVREGAVVMLFRPFGVAGAAAAAAGLVFTAVVLAGGLVGGAIATVMGRRAAAGAGGGS